MIRIPADGCEHQRDAQTEIPGREKDNDRSRSERPRPLVALWPYRPRCRAGIGTLAAREVAGRVVGPKLPHDDDPYGRPRPVRVLD